LQGNHFGIAPDGSHTYKIKKSCSNENNACPAKKYPCAHRCPNID
jgi:hypothetical protein